MLHCSYNEDYTKKTKMPWIILRNTKYKYWYKKLLNNLWNKKGTYKNIFHVSFSHPQLLCIQLSIFLFFDCLIVFLMSENLVSKLYYLKCHLMSLIVQLGQIIKLIPCDHCSAWRHAELSAKWIQLFILAIYTACQLNK